MGVLAMVRNEWVIKEAYERKVRRIDGEVGVVVSRAALRGVLVEGV